jgi:hypothetical protein
MEEDSKHINHPNYTNKYELMLNIFRILSRLTLVGECRNALVANGDRWIRDALNLLKIYSDKAALVVRVCFVLGNMTGHSQSAALQL